MTHTLKGVPSYDGYECAQCHQRFGSHQYQLVSTLPCPASVEPPAKDSLLEQQSVQYVPASTPFDTAVVYILFASALGFWMLLPVFVYCCVLR